MGLRRFLGWASALCAIFVLAATPACGVASASGVTQNGVQPSDQALVAIGCSSYADCSPIWSGYKEQDTSFTAISGTWTVPSVQTATQYENSSTWVGISGRDVPGGPSSGYLIQAGTQQYVSGDAKHGFKAHYKLWWEVLPGYNQINIGSVSPGDTINCQIYQTSPGNWTINISDQTSGLTFNQPKSFSPPAASGPFQAEWIEEAPTTVGVGTDKLANFGSVTFSNMAATSSSTPTVVPTQLVQPNGTIASYPGPITNNSFTVTYGSNPPASLQPVGPVPTPPTPVPQPQVGPAGYWLEGQDGGIFAFGNAGYYGSTGAMSLQRPIVGMAAATDLAGYTLVGSDGGIFAFGSALYAGSIPELGIGPAGTTGPGPNLNAPIVGIVPTRTDGGYFLVGADGGVFAFGDATYTGSCPAIGGCVGNVVAVMPEVDGGGYWVVTDQGYVYAFGDASYEGAPGPRSVSAGGGGAPVLNPVVSAAATQDGEGYWIVFADGTVAALGDATNYGSPNGLIPVSAARSIVPTNDSGGYWVIAANGAVFAYGDAPYQGGMSGMALNQPIIAAAGW